MADVMNWGNKIGSMLKSNEALTSSLTSGFKFAGEALKDNGSIKDAFNTVYKTSSGGLNYANLAGTAFGVSAAGRIASGGGLYKNSRGETDLIGVPFI